MENGEHCTSTVYKSLLEAKLIKKLPFWVICTPKSFLKHLKRSKLRHTAGTKKGKDIVNITPKMLDRYLYDINRLDLKDSIISYDITKKEYHHKMIHREMQKYKTSDYKNIIYVEAYPNKTFRLVINYSYTVQFGKGEEPISVESSISYSFKIINRKIVDFDIQESG